MLDIGCSFPFAMKRRLFILALFAMVSTVRAAVGDAVSGTGTYVAEGVSVKWVENILQTSRANSTRLYDSNKGAEWVGDDDSLMCWLHASANVIQYWQSYYAVFAKPQRGSYYDYDASFNSAFPEYSDAKPLPYGRIGTEAPSTTDDSVDPVPDGKRLYVARDMYFSIPNPPAQPRNMGGVFSWAAEWFFRGADKWKKADGSTVDLSAGGMVRDTGGYYANYFGTGEFFEEDLSYTTVYSDVQDKVSDVHNTTAGSPFGSADMAAVKDLLLKGFGVENGVQAQSGMIVTLGTTNSYTGNGHVITCYGFTTDEEGNLKSLLVADNNGSISAGSALVELFVKAEEYTDINGNTNKQIGLYRKADFSSSFSTGMQGGVNCITSISYINTPEVLKNMLAEYSDTANEAQVWNGSATEWTQQQASIEELPTAATGWDVNVDGENIAEEHRGYYHTYATDGRSVLFDAHAAEDKRSVTIVGEVAASSIDVAAAGYEFKAGANAELKSGAALTIHNLASLHSEVSLNLHDLVLGSGAALSSDLQVTVSGGVFHAVGDSVASAYTLRSTATPAAEVKADLNLTGASSIILENTVDMNGYSLYLHEDTPITLNFAMLNDAMLCFANVGKLFLTASDGSVQSFAPGADLTPYLSFLVNDAPIVGARVEYSDVGEISLIVPEPASTTLSMVGLALLALRRRRKCTPSSSCAG